GGEHREVVREHEDTPVVGVGGVDPTAPRRQRVVVGDRRLLVGDRLADPRARATVRGEEDPFPPEGVPAELPGHGVAASMVTVRSSQPFVDAVTVIVPGPVGRTTANARPWYVS